jgi:hypothetical protein
MSITSFTLIKEWDVVVDERHRIARVSEYFEVNVRDSWGV